MGSRLGVFMAVNCSSAIGEGTENSLLENGSYEPDNQADND